MKKLLGILPILWASTAMATDIDISALVQPQDTTARLVVGSIYISISEWDKTYSYKNVDLTLDYSKHKLGSLGYHYKLTDTFGIFGGAVLGQQKEFNEGTKIYPEFGGIYEIPNSGIVVSVSYDSLVQVPVVGVGGRW